MKNPFDHFEKIVCICGQHEPERWEQVQKEFERIGILDRIERFDEVIDSDWLEETYGYNPEWSKTDYCHYKIIRDAHESGLKNIFIFESDIVLLGGKLERQLESMKKSIDALSDIDWKLFYMGGVPHNVYGVINENLVNVSMCQAHAYAINGKYCKEVSDAIINNKIAIDQVYHRGKRYGLSRGSYASNPRFFRQDLGEDEENPQRRRMSAKMWDKLVEPAMEMYKKNIEFVVAESSADGKQHRVILSNFKYSLDNVGIPASGGLVKTYTMEFSTEYEKLELIHGILKSGKICLYSDADVTFLKNPLDKLYSYIEQYDLIIQSNAEVMEELSYYKTVVNPGFCMVRPTELTLKLFDTSESCEFLYEDCRPDMAYINSKLNSSDIYHNNLKMKILDEDEFCVSLGLEDRLDTLDPYMIHFCEHKNRIFHPKNKIARMRSYDCYFVPD